MQLRIYIFELYQLVAEITVAPSILRGPVQRRGKRAPLFPLQRAGRFEAAARPIRVPKRCGAAAARALFKTAEGYNSGARLKVHVRQLSRTCARVITRSRVAYVFGAQSAGWGC